MSERGGKATMGLTETPAKRLAEALVESPLYGHVVQGFADEAWKADRGYNGRVGILAKRLQEWMRERNPIHDDGPPLELFFFGLAVDSFDWNAVAWFVAEDLDMPAPKKPTPKPRLR